MLQTTLGSLANHSIYTFHLVWPLRNSMYSNTLRKSVYATHVVIRITANHPAIITEHNVHTQSGLRPKGVATNTASTAYV
jgi:hypothetical protein